MVTGNTAEQVRVAAAFEAAEAAYDAALVHDIDDADAHAGKAYETALRRPVFRVVKRFINGPLVGLRIEEFSSVAFRAGYRCVRPIGGSGYEVEACEPA